jgi:hypothetical protein
LIFSKLQSGLWPNIELVSSKCQSIVIEESNGRDVSAYLAGSSPNKLGSPQVSQSKPRKNVKRDVTPTKYKDSQEDLMRQKP